MRLLRPVGGGTAELPQLVPDFVRMLRCRVAVFEAVVREIAEPDPLSFLVVDRPRERRATIVDPLASRWPADRPLSRQLQSRLSQSAIPNCDSRKG